MQAILALPTYARPRERLLQYGPSSLDLEELITIILGSGSRGNPVQDLAKKVVSVLHGTEPTVSHLAEIPGIGLSRAATLIAAYSFSKKVDQLQFANELNNPEAIFYSLSDILDSNKEHVVAFFLDSRFSLVKREIVSIGTVNMSLIHPREVFRPAILNAASHIVIAHNHPTGNTTPSQADIDITKRLSEAGSQLGIELLDHLVCGVHGYTSLKIAYPHLFCYAKPV